MSFGIQEKRKKIHKRVVIRLAEMLATMTAFFIIFSILITISNWSAYSMILQDMINPRVYETQTSQDQMSLKVLQEAIQNKQVQEDVRKEIEKNGKEGSENSLFSLKDIGKLYPDEMQLEVPKVFSGKVPIKKVDGENFNFREIYESENKIQEALRKGVVRYPYTADPDEYGNVFITGHSSYYPWDKGKYKEIFALLHKLEIGDKYHIYYKGKKYTYKVFDVFEVEPDDLSSLSQPTDKKISTLMTCTPVGTTLRRLIVKAELIEVQ